MRHGERASGGHPIVGRAVRVAVAAGIVVVSIPVAAFCASFVFVALLAASSDAHAALVLGVAVAGAVGTGVALAGGLVGAWAVLTVDWRSVPSVVRDAIRRRRGV